jgi:hypothetical protein
VNMYKVMAVPTACVAAVLTLSGCAPASDAWKAQCTITDEYDKLPAFTSCEPVPDQSIANEVGVAVVFETINDASGSTIDQDVLSQVLYVAPVGSSCVAAFFDTVDGHGALVLSRFDTVLDENGQRTAATYVEQSVTDADYAHIRAFIGQMMTSCQESAPVRSSPESDAAA